MTRYTVTINCDPYWVSVFSKNSTKLAMGILFDDGSGNDICNVVASVGTVSTMMVASWQDKYEIAGTTQPFVAGQPVMLPSSTPQGVVDIISLSLLEPITYQQEYVMPTWGTSSVRDNQNLPKNSFSFNNGVIASAIVTIPILGDSLSNSAAYISPFQNPPGKSTITPLSKALFWFQNVESQTMISGQSNACKVDLAVNNSATISYGSDGKWSQSS